jgi:2'-5' RNA ligase
MSDTHREQMNRLDRLNEQMRQLEQRLEREQQEKEQQKMNHIELMKKWDDQIKAWEDLTRKVKQTKQQQTEQGKKND